MIGRFVHIVIYQSLSVLLHITNSIIPGSLGLNAFNLPWELQVSYLYPAVFSPHVLSQHITGQYRFLIHIAPHWMKGPWLLTIFNILENISYWYPMMKDLIRGVWKNGWVSVLERVYEKKIFSVPKLADFLLGLIIAGLAWYTIIKNWSTFQGFIH